VLYVSLDFGTKQESLYIGCFRHGHSNLTKLSS